MFNQQKMLEQIGFPIPQPPKMYKPRYKESVLRFLASFLIGFLTKLFTLPFDFSTSCWGITYGFVVLYLHIKKIPKEPSFGAEN